MPTRISPSYWCDLLLRNMPTASPVPRDSLYQLWRQTYATLEQRTHQPEQRSTPMPASAKKTRISKFPEVPRDANGKEPLMYAKIEAFKGMSVLYIKSAALEDILSGICTPIDCTVEHFSFPTIAVDEPTISQYIAQADDGIDVSRFDAPAYWYNELYNLWQVPECREMRNLRLPFEELNGTIAESRRGILFDGYLNVQAVLTPGLRDGKMFLCKFPMTNTMAKDIVTGLVGVTKRLVQYYHTTGAVEAVLFEGEAA